MSLPTFSQIGGATRVTDIKILWNEPFLQKGAKGVKGERPKGIFYNKA